MRHINPSPIALAVSLILFAGCTAEKPQVPGPSLTVTPPMQEQQAEELLRKRSNEGRQEASIRLADRAEGRGQPLAAEAPQPKSAPARSVSQPFAYSVTPPAPAFGYSEPPADREKYARFSSNPIKSARVDPLSTFGVDVDTASYALARQMLNQGSLPRPESVRVEEWINYFDADYPIPVSRDQPFSVTTEIAPAPWDADRLLLSVGLKGYEVPREELPPLNLTFLIDVSGSMGSPNKLPLAINSLKMLTRQLRDQDRIAIVVYAGAAGLVLDSTPGSEKQKIIKALDNLGVGGSTAGGAGIQLAYKVTREHHQAGDLSRVILLSDGDFNVGTTGTDSLRKMVAKERESGVSLSVMTFGRGNIRDELMNTLAENGNGTAAYIDSAQEAKKHLVDGMAGTLMTIAKDTKAQIEFNPAVVSEYRLIGYETRHLEHHEFNDDTKDAGDIGAGHTVTALYEVILHDSPDTLTPRFRYQANTPAGIEDTGNRGDELAFLKLRYKRPQGDTSSLITQPILRSKIRETDETSDTFRWNAAVAAAAQHARGLNALRGWTFADSQRLAATVLGADRYGHKAEFVRLMSLAASLEQPLAGISGEE